MTQTSSPTRPAADDPHPRPLVEGEVEGRDADLGDLDDEADRDELRRRYYGLLQEVRVVLPGVQVLAAFLLTVPFASRFEALDRAGRVSFGVSMLSALGSVACLVTPTVFHRVAPRTARRARLVWGIRLTMGGIALLALALLSALWCITRLVFGSTVALVATLAMTVLLGAMWLVLPTLAGRSDSGER